jgi:ABC-2 type transport system ATP-binding protein
MDALIEVDKLVKDFQGVRAVDGVSFAIERGSCFGLLGPNGAGKTTTVEILEGIREPTSGTILYNGAPLDASFHHEAGIMFQSTALQEFITARETLAMFQRFYTRSASIDELVAACSLESFLDRDTRKLSGGQRQRLLLAIALINDPEVVFLDEPTTRS